MGSVPLVLPVLAEGSQSARSYTDTKQLGLFLSSPWLHLISVPKLRIQLFFFHTGIPPLCESLDATSVSETKAEVTVGVTPPSSGHSPLRAFRGHTISLCLLPSSVDPAGRPRGQSYNPGGYKGILCTIFATFYKSEMIRD